MEVYLTSASTYSLYPVRKQGYQKTPAVWDLLGDYYVSFVEPPDQGLGHVATQAYRPQVKGWYLLESCQICGVPRWICWKLF